jgi:amino acid transporter
MSGTQERNPTLALALAAVALALLIGLPFVMEPPETTQDMILTGIAGLVLVVILAMGVVSFVRHRRRPFPDSVMPPPRSRKEPTTKIGDK